MAIQFYCTGCSEPIEVDDELAGQSAGCPYCQQVIRVPLASTYRADSPAARPVKPDRGSAGNPHPPGPGPVADEYGPASPDAATIEANRRATRYGNGALLCLGLTVACAVALMAIGLSMLPPLPVIPPGSDAGPIVREWQREALERAAQNPNSPLLNLLSLPLLCGIPLLALLALVLGVLSLVQSGGRNWRGWVSTLGSALLTCVVGAMLLAGLSMQGGAG
jgi:hypothetical protein